MDISLILGISQRDCTSYYEFLLQQHNIIEEKLILFFEQQIQPLSSNLSFYSCNNTKKTKNNYNS
jgi:hypothetical protein